MSFAKSLEAFGITQRKAVNMFSANSWQWVVAYMGAIFHNNIASGIYATTNAEGCVYQSNHSEAEVIIVDNIEKLRLYVSILDKCPSVKVVAAFGLEGNKVPADLASDKRIMTFDQFMRKGEGVSDSTILNITNGQSPAKTTTLVYTSGTTGNPKGVMLSHYNLVFVGKAFMWNIGHKNPRSTKTNWGKERIISNLPMSHMGSLFIDVFCHIAIGCHLYIARPDALQGSLFITMKQVRPTIFFTVPRVWEKIEDLLNQKLLEYPKEKQAEILKARKYGTARINAVM